MDEEQKETISQPAANGASTPEELAAIRAQLEEEARARAALEAAIAGREARIGELESAVSEAKSASEAKQADLEAKTAELEAKQSELDQARAALDGAVARYREALRTANPEVPEDLIEGDSVDEVFSSFQRSTAIVNKVRANLEAEAKAARVPAGAPASEGPSLEGLSPREKIAAGVRSADR